MLFNKKKPMAFFRDTAGVVAVIFALSIPMVIGAAGIAVDIAQAYNIKSRLGDALDKAALAAGSMPGDNDDVEEKVEDFFQANYPADKLGTPYNFYVDIGDDSIVTVSANARVDTTFMAVLGIDTIEVFSEVQVKRELRGLEVVMVLDNTGSMSTNNNIGALRTASTNFINILFDAVADPTDIKIGMVPYSSSVRIACYSRGQNYNPATGSCSGTYNGGATFVTLPSGVSYSNNRNSSTGWYGCVTEHMSTNYTASATHVTNSYGQLWRTGTQCSTQANCRGHGWDATATANDPYPNDIPDSYTGPWDIYMYGTVTRNCTGTCNPKYTFNKDSMPNRYCPYANVVPLSSSRSFLLSNVNTMQADGSTLSNTGMAWGYRVLSPEAPFREGVAWNDEDWRKAVIIMTDGETSMGGDVTSYWITSRNNIDNATLDDRLGEICTALKQKNVVIYTVTFSAAVSAATKQAYRECATTESYYFDAPSQSSLIDTFENIARQLANLHIVK